MTPIKTGAEILAWLGVSSPTAQQTAVADVVAKGQTAAFANFIGYNPVQATVTEYLPAHTERNLTDPLLMSFDRHTRVGPDVQTRTSDVWRQLQLRVLPVRSITNVWQNPGAWETAGGVWDDAHRLDPSAYFLDAADDSGRCESGILFRNTGEWGRDPRSIKVVYVGGLTAEELAADRPEIVMAFYESCQVAYTAVMTQMPKAGEPGTGVVSGFHIDAYGVNYDTSSSAKLYGMGPNTISPRAMSLLKTFVNYSRYL